MSSIEQHPIAEETPAAAEVKPHPVGRQRALVLGCTMLAMFMAAIEATIVATAMPEIVGDLGGFHLYTWVFSGFLLMQAAMTPVFGKLGDLYGRKPMLIGGITIFLAGALLCGLAWSMASLIAFRFLQGIGAGSIQPLAATIVGDLYPGRERAQVQGYLSSVWGISAIVGPLAGGLIVEYFHWAWIFWLNLPIGLATIAGLVLFLDESVERVEHRIDFLGAALFLASIAALMVVLAYGGSAWGWTAPATLGLLGVFVLGSIALLGWEHRVAEPLVPLAVWRIPLIALANLTTLVAGMMLIGLTSFVPPFVQGVLGRSALVAGFALTAMSIGWPLASTLVGTLYDWIGPRAVIRLGGALLAAGGVLFLWLDASNGALWVGVASFVTGLGMGLINTTFIVLIQGSVGWQQRGAATASNMFMRILGASFGAAVLGGVLNLSLAGAGAAPATHGGASLAAGVAPAALASGLHAVFIGVFVFAVVAMGLALWTARAGEIDHVT